MHTAWSRWKRVSGAICDQRVAMRAKGKVYKTTVRPVIHYGSTGQETGSRAGVGGVEDVMIFCFILFFSYLRRQNIKSKLTRGTASEMIERLDLDGLDA